MKRLIKVLSTVAIVAITCIGTTSFGQATATANADAHAIIVTPISIAKVNDMNFGNVAVGGLAGTVVLPVSGTRNATGGVTLPSLTGTVSAASYAVTGQPNYVYGITLPSSVIMSNGANTMIVGSIISNPATSGALSAVGTQLLTVGGTLSVGASQVAGAYNTAAAFPVTVVYN